MEAGTYKKLRVAALAMLGILFCTLLFKNISYPLLWNDESETIMTAEKILQFGYPKVHDGKHTIFIPAETTWIGYSEKLDANVSQPWGHYYFATIGTLLAKTTDDIYQKTALLRIPIALMGLLGLLIFILSLKGFFSNRSTYEKFVIAFIFFQLFSISFFLHMREARSYSLVVFITACFFYVFNNYFLIRNYSFKKYFLLMSLVLFLAYQINYITFSVCVLFMALRESWHRLVLVIRQSRDGNSFIHTLWKQVLKGLKEVSPIFTALVLIAPFIIVLDVLDTASRASAHFTTSWLMYRQYLSSIFRVLFTQELLAAALIVKVLQLIIWRLTKIKRFSTAEDSSNKLSLEKLTFSLSLFVLCYVLVVAKLPFQWTRYFIVLQPIILIILLIDSILVLNFISSIIEEKRALVVKLSFVAIVLSTFLINSDARVHYVKSYIYQLSHQLKGPLDYLIPHIQAKYSNSENLLLATNYEELAYIYYLDCRVMLGWGNRVEGGGVMEQPDLIVYRKTWGHNPQYYYLLMQQARYERTAFPVFDYYVNDIPELHSKIRHQFRTKLATNDGELTTIYERVK